jgi:hypothetical protein
MRKLPDIVPEYSSGGVNYKMVVGGVKLMGSDRIKIILVLATVPHAVF